MSEAEVNLIFAPLTGRTLLQGGVRKLRFAIPVRLTGARQTDCSMPRRHRRHEIDTYSAVTPARSR